MKRKIISAAWFETSTLNVCGLKYWSPGWASSARKSIASRPPMTEEDDRRDDVLDPDHLVVGVDAEVVAPRPRAVPRVILGARRPARGVVGPVVEAAEAGEEAERGRDELDREDHRALPDRMPVGRPAEEHRQRDAEPEERAASPRAPAASPGAVRRCQPARGGRRCVEIVSACGDVGHGSRLPVARYCTSCCRACPAGSACRRCAASRP